MPVENNRASSAFSLSAPWPRSGFRVRPAWSRLSASVSRRSFSSGGHLWSCLHKQELLRRRRRRRCCMLSMTTAKKKPTKTCNGDQDECQPFGKVSLPWEGLYRPPRLHLPASLLLHDVHYVSQEADTCCCGARPFFYCFVPSRIGRSVSLVVYCTAYSSPWTLPCVWLCLAVQDAVYDCCITPQLFLRFWIRRLRKVIFLAALYYSQ